MATVVYQTDVPEAFRRWFEGDPQDRLLAAFRKPLERGEFRESALVRILAKALKDRERWLGRYPTTYVACLGAGGEDPLGVRRYLDLEMERFFGSLKDGIEALFYYASVYGKREYPYRYTSDEERLLHSLCTWVDLVKTKVSVQLTSGYLPKDKNDLGDLGIALRMVFSVLWELSPEVRERFSSKEEFLGVTKGLVHPGKKITRMLADIVQRVNALRSILGINEEIASISYMEYCIVEYGQKLATYQTGAFICLTQDPVEIALMSDFADFTTCHTVLERGGAYSAGTQQYMYMPEVWLLYAFSSEEGVDVGQSWKVPRRLSRRIVYVSARADKVLVSRVYGLNALKNDFLLTKQDLLAKMWRDVFGKEFRLVSREHDQVGWYFAVRNFHDGSRLFYPDLGHSCLYFTTRSNGRPGKVYVRPANRLICPVCGSERNTLSYQTRGWFGMCRECQRRHREDLPTEEPEAQAETAWPVDVDLPVERVAVPLQRSLQNYCVWSPPVVGPTWVTMQIGTTAQMRGGRGEEWVWGC